MPAVQQAGSSHHGEVHSEELVPAFPHALLSGHGVSHRRPLHRLWPRPTGTANIERAHVRLHSHLLAYLPHFLNLVIYRANLAASDALSREHDYK